TDTHLKDVTERLRAAGVDDLFVPAGDADPPAGPYEGALPVLRRLTELGGPFAETGITGYPESHPLIHDDLTIQAMWDKRAHATYIVSNLCFDARVLGDWLGRIRRRDVTLPVYIGVAGPVQRAKLLTMATKIGVGESTRFLTRHASWFMSFANPVVYEPDLPPRASPTRSGCSPEAGRRSPRRRQAWRASICSPSTRLPRRSGGAVRCWTGWAADPPEGAPLSRPNRDTRSP
ncbi:hypothetical protein ACFV23_23130, partial [Streptomyces sp. NPDC059627]